MYIKFETARTTQGTGDETIYVNTEFVTGIQEWRKDATVIFTTGGQCFHLKGTLEEVVSKLSLCGLALKEEE